MWECLELGSALMVDQSAGLGESLCSETAGLVGMFMSR